MKNWGICEYFMGQHEFAANMLDSLSKMVLQDDPFVYFYAGVSYRKMGEVDTAQYFLEKAAFFAVPAFTADIYHHLGRNYAQLRMFPEAIKTYKKVREIDPTNYQVLYDIAVTYEEYNMNRTLALAYYQHFVQECNNEKSADLNYALDRIKRIKEEQFFKGQ